MSELTIRDALAHAAGELRRQGKKFALVGGLAVSVRGEVRSTRDVDLAVAVANDAEAEALVASLAGSGYRVFALLEQEARGRIATVRLTSPLGVLVDLMIASCGIEPEIVASATSTEFKGIGAIPVARAEDLLAMKVLSAREGRARDWDDARGLLKENPKLDLALVRARLSLITTRGFARKENLSAKLEKLLAELRTAP
jgi:hypothetical protein